MFHISEINTILIINNHIIWFLNIKYLSAIKGTHFLIQLIFSCFFSATSSVWIINFKITFSLWFKIILALLTFNYGLSLRVIYNTQCLYNAILGLIDSGFEGRLQVFFLNQVRMFWVCIWSHIFYRFWWFPKNHANWYLYWLKNQNNQNWQMFQMIKTIQYSANWYISESQ